MTHSVRNKLSIMMFLEFFIWGAWLPLIFGYLGSLNFSSLEQSWILNAFALASFTAMFFSTQFADRNFAAEKFVAFSHLVGGLAILGLAFVTDFWPFFALMLIHSLFYVPTISITNSIAFANLKDAQRDYGLVRYGGRSAGSRRPGPLFLFWSIGKRCPHSARSLLGNGLGRFLAHPRKGLHCNRPPLILSSPPVVPPCFWPRSAWCCRIRRRGPHSRAVNLWHGSKP